MNKVLVLDKAVGETPLECMDRFRVTNPEYVDVKMTYAGRLDPMADGVLIVLVGDAIARKDEFLGLDKEYICTAILGVATDTYDILGLPQISHLGRTTPFSSRVGYGTRARLEKRDGAPSCGDATQILQSFVGTFEQSYPPYSSKTINGVQMHQLAREGKLDGVEMPKRGVTVYGISDIEIAAATRSVAADIILRIQKVKGDFRQQEIMAHWRELDGDTLQTVTFKITVSSGTYIRGIVDELGKKLGCGACIWKLTRMRVGEYKIKNKTAKNKKPLG